MAHRSPGGLVRILLADDEDQLRGILTRVLQAQGWEVLAVPNGREAVEAWPQDGQPFDLLILDLRMPELGGVPVWRALRERQPQPQVLFISGHGTGEQWDVVLEEGLPYLRKPFRPSALVSRVRELMTQ